MSLNIFFLGDETIDYALCWIHFEEPLADDKVEKLTSATGFDQYWSLFEIKGKSEKKAAGPERYSSWLTIKHNWKSNGKD